MKNCKKRRRRRTEIIIGPVGSNLEKRSWSTKAVGVVLEEPSGDESVGRGQHANEGILGGTLGQFGVPAPGNGKAAKIGKVQLVSLEGRDDGVNLFSSVFQLGQASPVLDVGFDPLVDLSLGSFRRCVVLQYWSIGADNIGMERVRRNRQEVEWPCPVRV